MVVKEFVTQMGGVFAGGDGQGLMQYTSYPASTRIEYW